VIPFKIKLKDGYKVVSLNRKKAIRYKCLDCSGWHPKEASRCIYPHCPLFPFRSGQGHQEPKARKAAIVSYCRWCMNGSVKVVRECPSMECPLFPYRMGKADLSAVIKADGGGKTPKIRTKGLSRPPDRKGSSMGLPVGINNGSFNNIKRIAMRPAFETTTDIYTEEQNHERAQ